MDTLSQIGNAIQRVRKTNSLTQQQLADLAGISERTLRSIESGDGNPSFGAVLSVAEVLGISITVEQ